MLKNNKSYGCSESEESKTIRFRKFRKHQRSDPDIKHLYKVIRHPFMVFKHPFMVDHFEW